MDAGYEKGREQTGIPAPADGEEKPAGSSKEEESERGHLVLLTEVNKSNAPSAYYSPTPSQVTFQNEGPNRAVGSHRSEGKHG